MRPSVLGRNGQQRDFEDRAVASALRVKSLNPIPDPMKKILLPAVILFSMTISIVANPFAIERIGRDKQKSFVDNGWKEGADCIEVTVSVDKDLPSIRTTIKAFFCAENAAPLFRLDRPTQVDLTGASHDATIPTIFEKGKKYTTFFAIPEQFLRGPKKWHRVIVVFGDQKEIAAQVFPKDDLDRFDFPGKSLLGGAPISSSPGSPGTASGNTPQGQTPERSCELKGKKYVMVYEKLDRVSAEQKCEAMGGRLAVFPDLESLEHVCNRLLEGRQHAWIGGSDSDRDGKWTWVDGSEINYNLWLDGQPVGQNKYLVATQDAKCKSVPEVFIQKSPAGAGFICELSP